MCSLDHHQVTFDVKTTGRNARVGAMLNKIMKLKGNHDLGHYMAVRLMNILPYSRHPDKERLHEHTFPIIPLVQRPSRQTFHTSRRSAMR